MFNKVVEYLPANWNDALRSGTNALADRVGELDWRSRSIILIPLIAVIVSLAPIGRGCPHEGPDQRLLGWTGCWVQRQLTIERAQPPSKIWSFNLGHVSVKIDPKHPHLLMEWPTSSGKLWRFRAGFRWDANARAYIFPAIAFKKVDGPMKEYEILRSFFPPSRDREVGRAPTT